MSIGHYYNYLRTNQIIENNLVVSGGILLTEAEAKNICKLIETVSSIDGNIIEVGTFNGGSAFLMSKATNKQIYTIDTFEGLADVNSKIDGGLKNKTIASKYENTISLLSDCKNVEVIRGYFPDVVRERFQNEKFSFVHLDVDTFLSTLNSLKYLYSKVTKGGIILTHDYKTLSGVAKAFDFFFRRREKIQTGSDSQAWIVKE
jgi:predicted O-methyltransferase YrrM